MRALFEDMSQWPNKSLEPTTTRSLAECGFIFLAAAFSGRGSALDR